MKLVNIIDLPISPMIVLLIIQVHFNAYYSLLLFGSNWLLIAGCISLFVTSTILMLCTIKTDQSSYCPYRYFQRIHSLGISITQQRIFNRLLQVSTPTKLFKNHKSSSIRVIDENFCSSSQVMYDEAFLFPRQSYAHKINLYICWRKKERF